MIVANQHEGATPLLRLVANREHNCGCTMKKTIIKTKLVLRKETTRALTDKDLARVGAGKDATDTIGTVVAQGCTGAADAH
jgi:hypothetical protein